MTKWAVIAPGKIATKFVSAFKAVEGATLVAVCSRKQENADAFADRFEPSAERYDDLATMLEQADFDVAYIANPHPFHFASAKACLEAGRAVLCEKPMTMSAKETAELVALAEARGVFLMEAIWMRCMPVLREVRQAIASGSIGEPMFLRASLTMDKAPDASHRLYAASLGGGSMLDLGIYPLAFADMMLGPPERLNGFAHKAETGVDDIFSFNAQYGNGAVAQLLCSMRFELENTAIIVGSDGVIHIASDMHYPTQARLLTSGGKERLIEKPHRVNGYEWEILEVQRALTAGKTQSASVPWETSIRLAEQMEQLLSKL